MTAKFATKAVTFAKSADSEYAGQTRYLGAKLTDTGRASVWCRHYHRTEGQATACARKLAGVTLPKVEVETVTRDHAERTFCPTCGDVLIHCPDWKYRIVG